MFGVSKSGYYAWDDRRKKKADKESMNQAQLKDLMEKFREIIRKLGFVPGKRAFRNHLWRDYDMVVSIKKCRRIMRMMNLVAKRPKKDAYKHQATHDHECTSPENLVKQNFYIGPRKVILTDITYLYYGASRTPIYLCAFKDAYTKEILGYKVSLHMNVQLVRDAYDLMMKHHASELHDAGCVIHSDQGSQYLSTTFKKILSDDKFLQSVSGRGNSQDNAPMESFFGRMKTNILDLIALCKDSSSVVRMIDGYINSYNNIQYQYSLAGLTPSEYYAYVTTGIYPLDNYFGEKAEDMMSINDLVKLRMNEAAKAAQKKREAAAKKRKENEAAGLNPTMIISRDQHLIQKEMTKWKQSKDTADKQLIHLAEVYEKTKEALQFVENASKEVRELLRNPQNWSNYPKLNYIYDMKEMF